MQGPNVGVQGVLREQGREERVCHKQERGWALDTCDQERPRVGSPSKSWKSRSRSRDVSGS